MPVFHARWILPIVGVPLRNGWVEVRGGRIIAVGDGVPPAESPPAEISRGGRSQPAGGGPGPDDVAILPGLVNAHTHLELSWMRGRVPPGGPMPAWASRLIALRGQGGEVDLARRQAAAAEGVREALAAGTSLVGDISNSPDADAAVLASGLHAVLFRELIGFRDGDPGPAVAAALASLPGATAVVRPTLAPHAPYSVSPRLQQAIAGATTGPFSIHLAESVEEGRFLGAGNGPWREVLEKVGAWEPSWMPPQLGPVDYLASLGLLGSRLLAVHGVQLGDAELARLAAAGATVVACPRSNRWVGAGTPPLARFYAAGVRVAVGTDSLASVDTLSVFDELAEMRRIAPDVPARALLRSATLDGAAALGFGGELGTIEPGRTAALLAVSVPAGTTDVEQYLVSGVPAERIRWLPCD